MCGPLVVFLLSSMAPLAWSSPPTGLLSCPPADPVNQTQDTVLDLGPLSSKEGCLNFSGKSFTRVAAGSPLGGKVTVLDLSQNNLTELRGDLLDQAQALEALHLQGNRLETFPPELLRNTPSLEVLSLEGNPLKDVNLSGLGHCLGSLSVDCRCRVVSSLLAHLENCTQGGDFRCLSRQGQVNLADFYGQDCRGGMSAGIYAAIAVPAVAVGLGLGLAAFLVRRRRRKASGIGRDKRGSSASEGPHGQPRYISHAGLPGDAGKPFGQGAEYENVQVPRGRPSAGQERRPPKNRTASQDEEPIYANAPNTYCNYIGPAGAGRGAEEDIYVVPDQ